MWINFLLLSVIYFIFLSSQSKYTTLIKFYCYVGWTMADLLSTIFLYFLIPLRPVACLALLTPTYSDLLTIASVRTMWPAHVHFLSGIPASYFFNSCPLFNYASFSIVSRDFEHNLSILIVAIFIFLATSFDIFHVSVEQNNWHCTVIKLFHLYRHIHIRLK